MAISERSSYDVVIVGGGHNGLTAAAYLARAKLKVLVLERLDHVGGAAVSAEAFPGRPTRLSRYSYLVSLMPAELMRELDLDVQLASRSTASYTPYSRDGVDGGLLVERPEGDATAASFRALTGGDAEYLAWRSFYGEVEDLARAVAPTLLEPLPPVDDLRHRVDAQLWTDLVEQPIGDALERRFADDIVRGVVATDALIGTFASLHDPSLVQNRCFLYHLVGNGTGEWKVPVGGMGAVTSALAAAATRHGAELVTSATVTGISPSTDGAEVRWESAGETGAVSTRFVLSNVAPWTLAGLLGEPLPPKPVGAQLKINMLLDRLPALRSGDDPAVAFAGTLHLAESYAELEAAYRVASGGAVPSPLPGEVYCHSLTDPSILGADAGRHTLTYFGLHAPSTLFESDPERAKSDAVAAAIASLDAVLAEPLLSVVARDAQGEPCIEAKIPQEIEADLGMPGGHIFHGDLQWPWRDDDEMPATPADAWGVATGIAPVLVCGSGARRGGAVSGIGGHNAAMAVLDALGGGR